MSEDLVRDVPMTVLADAEDRGKWTKFLTRAIDVRESLLALFVGRALAPIIFNPCRTLGVPLPDAYVFVFCLANPRLFPPFPAQRLLTYDGPTPTPGD